MGQRARSIHVTAGRQTPHKHLKSAGLGGRPVTPPSWAASPRTKPGLSTQRPGRRASRHRFQPFSLPRPAPPRRAPPRPAPRAAAPHVSTRAGEARAASCSRAACWPLGEATACIGFLHPASCIRCLRPVPASGIGHPVPASGIRFRVCSARCSTWLFGFPLPTSDLRMKGQLFNEFAPGSVKEVAVANVSIPGAATRMLTFASAAATPSVAAKSLTKNPYIRDPDLNVEGRLLTRGSDQS